MLCWAQVILWLLEDCPLRTYLPAHVVATMLHAVAHAALGAPSASWHVVLSYSGLGACIGMVPHVLPAAHMAERSRHAWLSAMVVLHCRHAVPTTIVPSAKVSIVI